MAPAPGPRARSLRRIAAAVLALGAPACALLLLLPDGWAINRLNVAVWIAVTGPLGLQGPVTPEAFAQAMNVLLFVPILAALAILVPSWWWVGVTAAGSAAVEAYQLIIGSRDADALDIIANTAGAALGAALGLGLLRRARRSDAAAGPDTTSGGRGTVAAEAEPLRDEGSAGPRPAGAAPRDASAPATPGSAPRASGRAPGGEPDDRD